MLRTASIGKLFLLIEIARQAEAGELDLGEELPRTDEDLVADSGLWHLMARDTFTVEDLCWLIGGFSDNLATNVLVRRIGIEAVTATSTSLGFVRSALLDRVRDDRGLDDPWTLSAGNAEELSELMARLHRGDIVSPEVSARVLRWVAANADLSMVASAFGLDPLAHAEPDRGVTLINKTGTISTVRGRCRHRREPRRRGGVCRRGELARRRSEGPARPRPRRDGSDRRCDPRHIGA